MLGLNFIDIGQGVRGNLHQTKHFMVEMSFTNKVGDITECNFPSIFLSGYLIYVAHGLPSRNMSPLSLCYDPSVLHILSVCLEVYI